MAPLIVGIGVGTITSVLIVMGTWYLAGKYMKS